MYNSPVGISLNRVDHPPVSLAMELILDVCLLSMEGIVCVTLYKVYSDKEIK